MQVLLLVGVVAPLLVLLRRRITRACCLPSRLDRRRLLRATHPEASRDIVGPVETARRVLLEGKILQPAGPHPDPCARRLQANASRRQHVGLCGPQAKVQKRR